MSGLAANFCATASGDGAAICAVDGYAAGVASGIDNFYLLFAGALVFLMQAGFAMLCAGSVRQKNVKNIMLKNILDACGGALGFFLLGYGFAYGNASGGEGITFIGDSSFALAYFDSYISFFFQWAFAATAATIVAGTVAERCKMAAYICYSLFLTAFVYPVVVHSIWSSNGFLSAFSAAPFRGVGNVDFAGSGVVHMTGGFTALIAAIVLGPRRGRFYDEDGNPLEEPASFPPHSVALQVLGTFILWFGWYGFNPGSTLAIASEASGTTAALSAVTTTMAAASGALSCIITDSTVEYMKSGEVSYDLTAAMNGALGGLVSITAGCSVVQPWMAIIIGMIGGVVYLGFSKFLVKMRIDDAVDAVPVHFACGAWGVLAVGFLADPNLMATAGFNGEHPGWFYSFSNGGSDANLLLCQICAILWIIGWVGALMTPFFMMLNYFNLFRVDPLEEEVGLDISHHLGAAYDMTAPSAEHVEELKEVRASRHGKVEVPPPEEGGGEEEA